MTQEGPRSTLSFLNWYYRHCLNTQASQAGPLDGTGENGQTASTLPGTRPAIGQKIEAPDTLAAVKKAGCR